MSLIRNVPAQSCKPPGCPARGPLNSGNRLKALVFVVALSSLGFCSAERKGPPGPINPALAAAILKSDTALVRRLVRAGADPNGYTSDHQTALHLAVQSGNEDVIRLLLSEGATPNYPKCCFGQTPMDIAIRAWSGQPGKLLRILELLSGTQFPLEQRRLDAAFRAALRSMRPKSPSGQKEQVQVLRFFIRRGVVLVYRELYVWVATPYHLQVLLMAAQSERLGAEAFFHVIAGCKLDFAAAALEAGVNVNATNGQESALDHVSCEAALKFLLEKGIAGPLRLSALERIRAKSRVDQKYCDRRDLFERTLDTPEFSRGSFLVMQPFGIHVRTGPRHEAPIISVLKLRHAGVFVDRSHRTDDRLGLWLATRVGDRLGWIHAWGIRFSACESIQGPPFPKKDKTMIYGATSGPPAPDAYPLLEEVKGSDGVFGALKERHRFVLSGYTVKIVDRKADHLRYGLTTETAIYILQEQTGRLFLYDWSISLEVAHMGSPVGDAFQIKHRLDHGELAVLIHLYPDRVFVAPSPLLSSRDTECPTPVQATRMGPNRRTLLVYQVTGICGPSSGEYWFDSFSVVDLQPGGVVWRTFSNQGIPEAYRKEWSEWKPVGKANPMKPTG